MRKILLQKKEHTHTFCCHPYCLVTIFNNCSLTHKGVKKYVSKVQVLSDDCLKEAEKSIAIPSFRFELWSNTVSLAEWTTSLYIHPGTMLKHNPEARRHTILRTLVSYSICALNMEEWFHKHYKEHLADCELFNTLKMKSSGSSLLYHIKHDMHTLTCIFLWHVYLLLWHIIVIQNWL